MNKPAVSPTWIELNIDRSGNEIRVSARGSRGEHIAARPMSLDAASLLRFASAVERAAAHGQPLDAAVLEDARKIQREVLGGEVNALFSRLKEAAGGPLLVRLLVHDAELQAVPWEALCNSGEALGFWGTSPHVLPARHVTSAEAWQPREVRGAVKVLAIAPTGSAGLKNLQQALADRLVTGEVEWLDPVEGRAAKVTSILERLRREPVPHVLHFLGHGGIDAEGRPALRMADEDEEEKWLPAEVLAQQLAASFRGMLRLIILEACEGAKPSAFASAAEILARAGADAVVAHLWPVRADVGRTCSTQFYRAMTAKDRNTGDIASAMNESRRAMLAEYESSAEALSPVLYLRAPDGKIFDFARERAPTNNAGTGAVVLMRVVGTPYAYQAPAGTVLFSVGRQRRKQDQSPNEGNDVVVRIPGNDARTLHISRRHLEIERVGSRWFLVDLSGGRTTVNGALVPASERVPLHVGDIIGLAGVMFMQFSTTDTSDCIVVTGPVNVGTKGFVMEASVGDMVTVRDA